MKYDYLAPDVVAMIGSVTDLRSVEDGSVDFVFASNLFEHLRQDEFAVVLQQVRTKLKPGGTLNILQPNYRFAYRGISMIIRTLRSIRITASRIFSQLKASV